MSTRNEHAIVLGGSMAGLLAARVLSEHFARVTLVERDIYPVEVEPRKGCRRVGSCTREGLAAAPRFLSRHRR
ncbi:MAG: hypothetical protein U0232_28685 [Thermomicrobiales bacterium]